MDEPVFRTATLKVAAPAASEGQSAPGSVTEESRLIPAEVPVAIVFDGSTHAVMMATPQDIEDFAIGFSLTEEIVSATDQIREVEVVTHDKGVEARVWLAAAPGRALIERRRNIAGPTGCGLCGVESLDAAVPEPSKVGHLAKTTPAEIQSAMGAMAPGQVLNRQTRATHAAAFWSFKHGAVTCVREDVGRHNALDKLVGHLARSNEPGSAGMVLLTSRVSVEMVQKTAKLGAEIIVAVSAPTALAIKTANAAGITLVAVARSDGFEVFTHRERIELTNNNGITGSGDYLHAVG